MYQSLKETKKYTIHGQVQYCFSKSKIQKKNTGCLQQLLILTEPSYVPANASYIYNCQC